MFDKRLIADKETKMPKDVVAPKLDNTQASWSLEEGDCIAQMSDMAAESVDLVFADPPYNLQLGGTLERPGDRGVLRGVDEDWDKFDSMMDYDQFTEAWLAQVKRLLGPNGSIWVMGSYHNIFRIGSKLQDMGFWILNNVTWVKSNPTPNFRGTRFTNSTETLIWAARDEAARPYFAYRSGKAYNDDFQMRSDWMIPVCNGRERMRDPNGRALHPTQKPNALIYRALMMTSRRADVVLDPFSGTGTTGSVCRRLGRTFIGIERDPDYARMARERIAQTDPFDTDSLESIGKGASERRVPIGQLMEAGLLKPGARLYAQATDGIATLRMDGSISVHGQVGSIHQVAARLKRRASVNGWDFWHLDPACTIPLDSLRQAYRDATTSGAVTSVAQ